MVPDKYNDKHRIKDSVFVLENVLNFIFSVDSNLCIIQSSNVYDVIATTILRVRTGENFENQLLLKTDSRSLILIHLLF